MATVVRACVGPGRAGSSETRNAGTSETPWAFYRPGLGLVTTAFCNGSSEAFGLVFSYRSPPFGLDGVLKNRMGTRQCILGR